MASVSQPQSHANHHTNNGQENFADAEQDCKISSSNHLSSPSANINPSEAFGSSENGSVGGTRSLYCATAVAEGTDHGVSLAGSSSHNLDPNGYSDNGFGTSSEENRHQQRRQGSSSRNPSGGCNNSESSISSSTNPSSVGAAGESDLEASGESSSANYRTPCVAEDDAGSSSHSEVRSSSPGLADADADVEDSPSGSEETGSESERGGGTSLTGNGAATMYAPNTIGFPPSRSSWTHSIPSGSFAGGVKFSGGGGSNPFAVKGLPAGSISSTSIPVNPVTNPIRSGSLSSSSSGTSCSSVGGGGLGSAFGGSSSGGSAVGGGRWGSGQPQPLKPSSWNSRPIIRPSALGSSLGGGVSSSSAVASPLPTGLGGHSANYFGMGGADSGGQMSENISTSTPSSASSGSFFALRPPKLPNPFGSVGSSGVRSDTPAAAAAAPFTEGSSVSMSPETPEPSSSSLATPSSGQEAKIISEPMFVPLKKEDAAGGESVSTTGQSGTGVLSSSSSAAPPAAGTSAGTFGGTSTSSTSSATPASGPSSFSSGVTQSDSEQGFVFGSNLRQRISGDVEQGEVPTNGISSSTSGDGLFSAALKNVQPSFPAAPSTSSSTLAQDSGGSLEAGSSTFGDESHSERKRRFDDTPVITGEEDEFNVLQITCRLFAFDSGNCSWIERGRGQLRLNDRTETNNDLQSRIIVRTKGSLRLMLNTNVWAGMKVDRASPKSVRFTANDNGHIRLFLVMATVVEADHLFQALDWRVKNLKTLEDKNGGGGSGSSSSGGGAGVEASSSMDTASITTAAAAGGSGESCAIVNETGRMDRRRSSHHSLTNNETGKTLGSSSSDEDSNSDDDDDDDKEDEELRNLPLKKKRLSEVVDDAGAVSAVAECSGSTSSSSSIYTFSARRHNTPPTIRINNHEMKEEDEDLD